MILMYGMTWTVFWLFLQNPICGYPTFLHFYMPGMPAAFKSLFWFQNMFCFKMISEIGTDKTCSSNFCNALLVQNTELTNVVHCTAIILWVAGEECRKNFPWIHFIKKSQGKYLPNHLLASPPQSLTHRPARSFIQRKIPPADTAACN